MKKQLHSLAIILFFASCLATSNYLVAQPRLNWQPTYGPTEPLKITISQFAPDHSGNIFFAYSYGLYHSTDDGATWLLPSYFARSGLVWGAMQIDKNDRIYLLTLTGVAYTDDKAISWTHIPLSPGADKQPINSFALSDSIIYVGYHGIFYSYGYWTSDLGISWHSMSVPNNVTDFRVSFVDTSGKLYGFYSDQMYFSTDRGSTWQIDPHWAGKFQHAQFVIALNDSTTLIAVDHDGLYLLTNSDTTHLSDLRDKSFHFLQKGLNDSTWIIGGTYDSVSHDTTFITHDRGKSWSPLLLNSPGTQFNTCFLTNTGKLLLAAGGSAGNDRSIWASTDNGYNWTVSDSNPTVINQLAASNDGSIWVCPHTYNLSRSTDRGQTWTDVYFPSKLSTEKIAINPDGVIFSCEFYDSIYKSTDNGIHWDTLNVPESENIAFLGAEVVFTGRDSSIYISHDRGEHWIQQILSHDTVSIPRPKVNSITVTLKGELWVSLGDTIYTSIDTGRSFTAVPSSITPDKYAHLPNGKTVAVERNTYSVYFTDDSLKTWKPLITFPKATGINDIMYAKQNIFIISDSGVIRTPDEGASWIKEDINITNRHIMNITQSGGYTYIGTDAGMYRAIDTMLAVRESHMSSSANSIILYPNPVLDQLIISMPGLALQPTSISILDITGRVLKTISNATNTSNGLTMSLAELPSGIYFLELESNGLIVGRSKFVKY